MANNLQSVGGVMPSGIPRNVPTDQNGIPISLNYWQSIAGEVAIPLSEYHEEYIYPSGVLRGADGRTNSYGAVNVGQFKSSAFYLDVTDMTRDDSDETLDVVIETSYNQGHTWTRVARFNTVNTTGTQNQVLVIEPSGAAGLLTDNDDIDPAAGTILTSFLGDRVRAAGTFTDAAGADASSVFSVLGIFKK